MGNTEKNGYEEYDYDQCVQMTVMDASVSNDSWHLNLECSVSYFFIKKSTLGQ